jgi:transcription elongation factor
LNLLICSAFHLLILNSIYWQKTLAVNEKELCKYFEPGNHVKVVSGTHEGVTGMVVKVEQHVLIILSDTTKEHVSDAFAA